jgi:hypothetical protein
MSFKQTHCFAGCQPLATIMSQLFVAQQQVLVRCLVHGLLLTTGAFA